ncbi:MAG: hypothetical protein QNJ46_17290 [Leptolyngbyaceae cyanobacterium MO_188.B28]|nr:hypothetical protein [Leptolyngbyaceae cyanobacterium MO_188.B28]
MNRPANFTNLFKTTKGHLIAVGIGLPILFIGLLIMTGSLGDTISLLLISIICTVGIGLAFWLLIAWIIGWFILMLFLPYSRLSSSTEPDNSASENKWEGGQTALRGYIQRSMAARATETQITSRLINEGWSETEIQQAYQSVRGQQ